ncbi:MAG: hypothetical protein KGN98_06985 [Alphaproteobacteria bacterium]|nr:hypothetical protein [Alphaproteobacteria bacterium]
MGHRPSLPKALAIKPFLVRLRHNVAGNIALMALVISVPLMLMVDGAIDFGRVYLIKDQLQGACDAAVLTTRKSISQNTLTNDAMANGQNFFAANFADGTYGTSNTKFQMSLDASGAVLGTATATTPTGLLGSLTGGDGPLSVNCAANMQIGHTDVMFALDTTGSMALANDGDSQSRLQAMQSAVQEFTDRMNTAANGTQARIRFGFVPFSSNVNVGYLLKPDWLVDNWTYQSRIAKGPPTIAPGSPDKNNGDWTKISGSISISYQSGSVSLSGGSTSEIGGKAPSLKCSNVPKDTDITDTAYSDWTPSETALPRSRKATRTKNGTDYSGSVKDKKCLIKATKYNDYKEWRIETVEKADPNTIYTWIYRPVEYDVTSLAGDGISQTKRSMIVPKLGDDQSDVQVTWDGCIEERDTVQSSDFSAIPNDAYDLNIDLVPYNDETRWRPFLPQLVYWRKDNQKWSLEDWESTTNSTRADEYKGGDAAVCPNPALKLSPMSRDQVRNYITSLEARGTTYLDIGMIWAARLPSPTGLFASENAMGPDGGPISRNIIFMTDGGVETHNFVYEAYGLSALDRRRTDPNVLPLDADQDALVDARFRAACEAAKAHGITVWTIAFGTALTDSLKSCATDQRYYMAANARELSATFASIAVDNSRLRLVK